MHIILNHSSMVPIYEQLMEQIKSDIIQSELKEGEALPSVRTLAGELRISALTVKKRDLLRLFMEKVLMYLPRINSLHLKQGRKR